MPDKIQICIAVLSAQKKEVDIHNDKRQMLQAMVNLIN